MSKKGYNKIKTEKKSKGRDGEATIGETDTQREQKTQGIKKREGEREGQREVKRTRRMTKCKRG